MKLNHIASALFALGMATQSHAAAVDLTSWEADGFASDFNWVVQPGNDSVLQTVNGDPTVFFDRTRQDQNVALSGTIRVETTSDDDYIGFVLGYDDDELTSGTADYILVTWKQANQSASGCTGGALAGLSIARVTDGNVPCDHWNFVGGVDSLKRANTLGSTGWLDGREYSFEINFRSNLIEVEVDGVLELSLTAAEAGVAAFDNGAFGFYNYSQANVRYSSIEETVLPPNNVPAPAPLALLSVAGLALLRRRR